MSSACTSTVLRLYGNSLPPRYNRPDAGMSGYHLVHSAKSLLRADATKVPEYVRAFGRAGFDERHCEVKVRPETVLQGDGYAVSVCDKDHRLRFQAQDPEPFLRKLDQSVFRSIIGLRHSRVHPLFLVKVTDCKADADLKELKMQLSIFKKNDFSLKYIVLQRDISTMVWRDITNMSTVGKGSCCDIKIPVENSALIWVVPFDRSQCDRLPSLLDQLNASLVFHVLPYLHEQPYLHVQQTKIKVRLVGMSDDLYHSRDTRLTTAGKIAGERKFLNCGPESGPLRTLSNILKVEFYRDGMCFKSSEFDIEKTNEDQYIDCIFDVSDLNAAMEAKVIDKNGHCVWSVGLNEIPILLHFKNCAMVGELPAIKHDKEERNPLITEPTKVGKVTGKVEERLELRSFKASGGNLDGASKSCTEL